MAFVRTSQGTCSDSKKIGGYRYDVFLSFRGEDTRKTFTDHLYTALNNAGFLTFRDDDGLERGKDIKPGLQRAIHLSRTSVVVFSEDYTSSRWCLDELVMILERKRILERQRPPLNHVVLPVFYHVDPSHVKKQTESIGKAFERHETSQSPKKVKEWRKALAEVADLAGMVLQNKADGGCNLSDDAFHRDLSNLSSLRTIKLNKNPIRSLPVFIKSLRRLDHLSFLSCERLESLVGLPKVHKDMDIRGCISLKKITYQSYGFQNLTANMENYNLVDWAYCYKLEPIDRVDVEMTKLLGLSNLGSMPAIRMKKPNTLENRWSPVQGLYQYGIFSTFFVGNEVPGQFSHKSTMSSISFIMSLLPDHKIRGLNIFATYAKEKNSNNGSTDSDSDVDKCYELDPIMIKVRNKSKGLMWIYGPILYGIPGEGEDIIWLSHWKMENESILQCGDEVLVLVLMRPNVFQLKEYGVELVQEHQDKMSTQHNTTADLPDYPFVIGGDLSRWEICPGLYLLGISKKIAESKESFDFSWRSWLNRVIMDSDEDDTGMLCCCIAMNYTSRSARIHLKNVSNKFYVICMFFIQRMARGFNEEDKKDEDTDTEEEQQDDSAIVATRVAGSNNSAGVYSSDNEEEKQDEDTDTKEEQQDDQTLVATRSAGSNNCGVKGWKVLITAAVLLVLLFFMWYFCSPLAKQSREKFVEFTVPT
ncbi:hypothetical protein DVH24_000745 [Malus domestica]|uniref:ADP-ribosyl cyclase/cyclic ADP-ribose hydrolase n=1 Tax=Malus domestica TaxID=3750 RepID=A0A498JYV8_MALDO|nr:hypothetical protein DVH24_000745 [Malus domestica]